MTELGHVTASAFSKISFERALQAGDSRRFNVDLKNNKNLHIENAIAAAGDPSIFSNYNETEIGDKRYVSYSDYSTVLVLRALANHLKYCFKIRTNSRLQIINGVIQTIDEGNPYTFHRRDITSFYESIPIDLVRKLTLESSTLTHQARSMLEGFLNTHCDEIGIPRGSPLSAALSELVMIRADTELRRNPTVYRYFRFADDILAFTYDKFVDFDELMHNAIPKTFSLNQKKYKTYSLGISSSNSPFRSFDFLGYDFHILNSNPEKSLPRPFTVSIADKKIRRIKTRVTLSLKHYLKDQDFNLLLDRLRFLSSNFMIVRTGINVKAPRKKVRSGLYFNYPHCRNEGATRELPRFEDDLRDLDSFVRTVLFSKGSGFATTLSSTLSSAQKKQLKRLSFYNGYCLQIMRRFNPDRIKEIKGAWINAQPQ